jgi:glutamate carboxypeptidase
VIESKWLNLLQSVVDINSGSGNTVGSDQVRQLLIPEFEALGFRFHIHSVHENHRVLVFDFPDSQPTLLLVGHLDTVFPPHSSFQKLKIEGNQLIGPGVIDMKGGIVLLLNILSRLKSEIDLKAIRIVINDDEEIGSAYSHGLLKELGKGMPYGLVFEPGLPDRSIVTSESGALWMELKVDGVAAHAGLEHKKGVNAGMELAHKLVKLSSLTNYSRGLTFSVGTLQGGSRANVVCEHASAKIDIRYVEKEDLDHILEELERIRAEMTIQGNETGALPTAEIRTLAIVPSFARSSAESLFPFLRAAQKETGQQIHGQHVGYTSDANHLAQTGMSLLVGLGPYGGGMHTDHEFMSLESYSERLDFGKSLVRSILLGI